MQRKMSIGMAAACMLATVFASGCSERETRSAAEQPSAAAAVSDTSVMGNSPSPRDVAAASPLGERINDVQIVSGIKAQFAADKDLGVMAVDVDSKEGMVTLSGVVTNSDAKVRADRIAKEMRDVKSVNNALEVKAG